MEDKIIKIFAFLSLIFLVMTVPIDQYSRHLIHEPDIDVDSYINDDVAGFEEYEGVESYDHDKDVNNPTEPVATSTRSETDTDGDGVPDDEDMLDNGDAIIVISIDEIELDDSADVMSEGDPVFWIWIDLDGDGNDSDEGEIWESPMFEDTDHIDDQGFEDGGILWHAMDLDDNLTDITLEILALDDDNGGDYELIDLDDDPEYESLQLIYSLDKDGPFSDTYSSNGEDDGNSDEIDGRIELSIHVLKGISIEDSTPDTFEISMNEGDNLHFEIDSISPPPSGIPIGNVYYNWMFQFQGGDDEWYPLTNESQLSNNYYDLDAQFGSEGEYLIAGIVYIFIDGHDCYLWDYRFWDVTVLHNNTMPDAEITVNETTIDQFDIVTFSASKSTDRDGDELTYFWDFGDGQVAQGEDVIHKYSNSGTYQVNLTVVDDESESDSTSVEIIVNQIDLSGSEYWTTLENDFIFQLITNYTSNPEFRSSKSLNIPLVFGYSLDIQASFVSELTVIHEGNATFHCTIEDENDFVNFDFELLETMDEYTVYYQPYFEFKISIFNRDGESNLLWDTRAPVPIASNVNNLDGDGEPLISIPVFLLGEIDIYTWDNPMKIYESSETFMNHSGVLNLDTDPITVVDVDILKFLAKITGFVPVISFGIKIIDYFVNLFLQGNLNIDLKIENNIGLLTRSVGQDTNLDDFIWFSMDDPSHEQTIDGQEFEGRFHGIMETNAIGSMNASIDLFFNLSSAGQSVYGLWNSMGEKGFIVGIWDTVTSFFSTGSVPQQDRSIRKTLWESGELLKMEDNNLYYWDYLSYSHDFVNSKPALELQSPSSGAESVAVTMELSWDGNDDDGDDVTYTIYLGVGSESNMEPVAENYSTELYDPELIEGQTYYWKIEANDGYETITSPTWHFSTIQKEAEEPDDEDKKKSDSTPGFEVTITLISVMFIAFIRRRNSKFA